MCGRARRALECLAGRVLPGPGIGWALAIPISGGRVVLDGYYPSPHPPSTPPGSTPLPYPADRSAHYTYTVHGTGGLASTKEILGVECAQWLAGRAVAVSGTASHLTPRLFRPPLAPTLSISQYISVFLSISQF